MSAILDLACSERLADLVLMVPSAQAVSTNAEDVVGVINTARRCCL